MDAAGAAGATSATVTESNGSVSCDHEGGKAPGATGAPEPAAAGAPPTSAASAVGPVVTPPAVSAPPAADGSGAGAAATIMKSDCDEGGGEARGGAGGGAVGEAGAGPPSHSSTMMGAPRAPSAWKLPSVSGIVPAPAPGAPDGLDMHQGGGMPGSGAVSAVPPPFASSVMGGQRFFHMGLGGREAAYPAQQMMQLGNAGYPYGMPMMMPMGMQGQGAGLEQQHQQMALALAHQHHMAAVLAQQAQHSMMYMPHSLLGAAHSSAMATAAVGEGPSALPTVPGGGAVMAGLGDGADTSRPARSEAPVLNSDGTIIFHDLDTEGMGEAPYAFDDDPFYPVDPRSITACAVPYHHHAVVDPRWALFEAVDSGSKRTLNFSQACQCYSCCAWRDNSKWFFAMRRPGARAGAGLCHPSPPLDVIIETCRCKFCKAGVSAPRAQDIRMTERRAYADYALAPGIRESYMAESAAAVHRGAYRKEREQRERMERDVAKHRKRYEEVVEQSIRAAKAALAAGVRKGTTEAGSAAGGAGADSGAHSNGVEGRSDGPSPAKRKKVEAPAQLGRGRRNRRSIDMDASPFHRDAPPDYFPFEVAEHPIKGRGLRTLVPIPSGAALLRCSPCCIIESENQGTKLISEIMKRRKLPSDAAFTLGRYKVGDVFLNTKDPPASCSWWWLMNHSLMTPNVRWAAHRTVRDMVVAAVAVATHDIEPGEFLEYNYGDVADAAYLVDK